MFRSLLINAVNVPAPQLTNYVIVGPEEIDGDKRAGVYSILDKSNLTMVSDRITTTSNNVSTGYTISWNVDNNNITYTYDTYKEKIFLNIKPIYTQITARLTATITAAGINEVIYKDIVCTYAQADYTIESISDWVTLRDAINNGTESSVYSGATTGCANKRFRLNCDLTLNYNSQDYSIGTFDSSSKSGRYFGGVFDGADFTITLNGSIRQTANSIRAGGLFNHVDNCSIKNLRVVGSLSGGNYLGGVVGTCRHSNLDRIYTKITLSGSYLSGIACSTHSYPISGGTTADTSRSFASSFSNICAINNVQSVGHTAILSYDAVKNIKKCFVLGVISSNNTSYNISATATAKLFDYPTSAETDATIFANDIYSKVLFYKGQSGLRSVIKIDNSVTPSSIANVLSFDRHINDDSSYKFAVVRYKTTATLNNISNLYSTCSYSETTSSPDSSGIYSYSGTKKTFNEVCEMSTFNSNWIKGDVGTPIINNQYATDDDVLTAAKTESYYGGY